MLCPALLTATVQRHLSILLRSVLMLLVWTGPVPVGHDHQTAGTTSSAVQFARHLSLFHTAGIAPSGWHLHWIMPGDRDGVLCSNVSMPVLESSLGYDFERGVDCPRKDVAQPLYLDDADRVRWSAEGAATNLSLAAGQSWQGSLSETLNVMRC